MVSSFQLANHVVGIMIDRDLDDDYLEEIHQIILDKIEEFGNINMFCEVQKGKHIPLKCLFEELKFKFNNYQNIGKLAVVTDLTWLRSVMNISEIILDSEIKTYDIEHRMEAITWVSLSNSELD